MRPLAQRRAIDNGKIEELLAQPGGQSWKHQDAQQVLRERLGEIYEHYMKVLEDLQQVMMKLLLSLGCETEQIQTGLRKELVSTRTPHRDNRG